MAKTTIYLSTDGKHTVQVETDESEKVSDAFNDAQVIYDQIVAKYGLKASSSPTKTSNASPQDAESAPICMVHGVPMNRRPGGVSKTGRAYPAFWACPIKNDDGSFCNYKPRT